MYQRNKHFLLGSLFVLIILIFAIDIKEVQSQIKYPTRAIDIIIPYGPGGASDVQQRITAGYLSKKWGVPINVLNKPGGNTLPAQLEVYNAAPDGYTLFGDNTPSSSLLGLVVKNLPFKIMDRTFIATTSITPYFIFVSSSSHIKSLKDLEAEAKKNPENFTWTSMGGVGGADSIARQFLRVIAVDLQKTKPIMAKSGPEAVTLTAGGHVKMGIGSAPATVPSVRSGMIRPLAITGKDRLSDLPDVPTTTEAGYSTVNTSHWIGISGPPKLPLYIVEIWEKVLKEMISDPEIISKMKNIGVVTFFRNSLETKEFVIKEIEEGNKLWSLK